MKALAPARAAPWDIERPALAPAIQVAQVMTTVRGWARRHGDRLRCAAAVSAVLALAGLQSALIWHGLAGERIQLTQPSHASTTHTTLIAHKHHDLWRDVRPNQAVATSAPARPAATTTAPAPTMSGTTLAVALITLTAALAFLAARVLLIRRPHGHEPAECQPGVQDPKTPDSPTGDAQPEAQQAMPFSGSQTSASDTVEDVTPADGDPAHADDSVGLHPEPENNTATTSATSLDQRTTSHAVGAHQTDSPPLVLFDRRLTQRVPFESNARLQWDDHDVAGTTVDLGMSGVRCRLPGGLPSTAAPDVGATLQVTLLLNGSLGVFQARVQWGHIDNDAPVIGLNFLHVQTPQQALLQSVILPAAD